LKAGDYVFKAGKINNNIYVVLRGILQVLKPVKNTDDFVVTEIKQGEHFNETAIFFNSTHKVSIKAITECDLMVINRNKALKILKEDSELAAKLLWIISKKLSERLMDTTQKYSETKEQVSDVSDHMQN